MRIKLRNGLSGPYVQRIIEMAQSAFLDGEEEHGGMSHQTIYDVSAALSAVIGGPLKPGRVYATVGRDDDGELSCEVGLFCDCGVVGDEGDSDE